MSRIPYCALFIVFVLCISVAAQEIPFKIEKGYLLIGGKAKQEFDFEAAVFTGSAYSFYDGSALKKMHLTQTNSNEMLTSKISREDAITLAYVPGIVVADQKPIELTMRRFPKGYEAMSQALGRNVDFILGVDYFDGKIVQFDFKSRTMRFLDKPPFDYDSAPTSSPSGGVRLVFKMDGHTQTVFGNMITLPVADEITLNGVKAPSLLNTGVVMPVTVGPYIAKKVAGGKESSGRTTLSKVAVGSYEMADVPATLSEIRDENEKLYTAVLGLGLLQNFTITFDWKNKWIVLEK
jgi:hypothetical protein